MGNAATMMLGLHRAVEPQENDGRLLWRHRATPESVAKDLQKMTRSSPSSQ